ncbi:translation initiation factor IF-2-like [Physeter macrocephalus]|uniref:Translation initiation factor IF-2-like n=1 Tax=Physeter macrocephalus TaxID=9755 RepID=A0A455C8I0_PHYMC|nr:translation initiation factor IF-2-like [Physeter catodon]|eukprot:XP_028352381.1 uncharacterized protein LOC114487273 [Physeter catodon]
MAGSGLHELPSASPNETNFPEQTENQYSRSNGLHIRNSSNLPRDLRHSKTGPPGGSRPKRYPRPPARSPGRASPRAALRDVPPARPAAAPTSALCPRAAAAPLRCARRRRRAGPAARALTPPAPGLGRPGGARQSPELRSAERGPRPALTPDPGRPLASASPGLPADRREGPAVGSADPGPRWGRVAARAAPGPDRAASGEGRRLEGRSRAPRPPARRPGFPRRVPGPLAQVRPPHPKGAAPGSGRRLLSGNVALSSDLPEGFLPQLPRPALRHTSPPSRRATRGAPPANRDSAGKGVWTDVGRTLGEHRSFCRLGRRRPEGTRQVCEAAGAQPRLPKGSTPRAPERPPLDARAEPCGGPRRQGALLRPPADRLKQGGIGGPGSPAAGVGQWPTREPV